MWMMTNAAAVAWPKPVRVFDASAFSRRLVAACLLVLTGGQVRHASPNDFTRFDGGGRVGSDCLLVEDVAGVAGGRRARGARCTHGDPACDVAALANGTGAFRPRPVRPPP